MLIALIFLGLANINWPLLALALLFSATTFSALGAFVSVAMREVFEAQTLANFIRFPMVFLGGVFVPVDSLPVSLQIIARLLPLTYAVEAFRSALTGAASTYSLLDLAVLAVFTIVFFSLAVRILAQQLD